MKKCDDAVGGKRGALKKKGITRGPICGKVDIPVRTDHFSNFSKHTTRVSARNETSQTVAHCTKTNYSSTYLPLHNTTT